jgi:LPS sulfotransferase NodH
MLLQQMPLKHNYKVIFMTRPVEEVVNSQRKMIDRLATKGTELDAEQLRRGLTAHRNEIRGWLQSVPHMEFLEMDYPTLVRDPHPQIARIVEFLGADRLPESGKMPNVVDPSLHRRKSS